MKNFLAFLLALAPVAALAAPAGAPAGGGTQMIIMMVMFVGIFWFMVWRPQSKRAKEHKALLAAIAKGDEIVTNAGITGKVVKVTDDYIQVEVAKEVVIAFQKHAVTATLPKGTIKAI